MRVLQGSLVCLAVVSAPQLVAEATCHGSSLAGVVHDSTQALIPGAALSLDGGPAVLSGSDGRFRMACVEDGAHHLAVTMPGFAERALELRSPRGAVLDVVMQLEAVDTLVEVNASEAPASTLASGPAMTLAGNQLEALADDPDDLQRELQQLSAIGGGNPANTTFAVDGFQGSSKLPPKSSIASIRVNPDQFSAEYREPPFGGGRVEVYTKPGQKAYHGALFLTNGSPWENARDPFSTSKAAIGKQRYGFELTGPVRRTGSDFALTLEHRGIDNFAVVNAVTLDATGNTVPTVANVATPQSLWLGTARLDWQLGPKNILIASYSANVNALKNVGVGGTTVAEGGYDSGTYEHMVRVSDVTTLSPRVLHEARVSLRWDGENDRPLSTAPQVMVAGAFTGGGASLGAEQLHELNVEADDDVIWTTRKHNIKFGSYLMLYQEHQELTTNFNGSYTFGGGTAPALDAGNRPIAGQTQTISGLEQYRRTLLKLPGGTPTAFSNVVGTPTVNFTQVHEALFAQDDWNLGHGLHIAYGLRYFLQTEPTALNAVTPRLGVLWSPNKKGTWTLHAHYGMFSGRVNEQTTAEVYRQDGVSRVSSIVYNPVYGSPGTGATPIRSVREFAPHLQNSLWSFGNIGGSRVLPHGFNFSGDYYYGRMWNDMRSANVNAPMSGVATGPRPGPANLNVLQVQNSGQGRVNAVFAGIEQHSFKRVQFFFGGVRVNIVDDTDDEETFTPQSTYSNVGEFAHRSKQPMWQVFGNATFKLPGKVNLSTNLNANGDSHYNITTGFDNNGDGNFNDRPQYAAAGTPGAIQTPFGLLTSTGGSGVFPRNKGVLPWTYHLDMNLQRGFSLTRNQKAEHQQTLTANLRSSNVLNHTNVTTMGGVLGSPLFGVSYAADSGRRVEAGLRYSF